MALSSMTGFARGHGVMGSYAWAWELKSVNAKGLDIRLRLPPGWDAVEVPVRTSAAQVLARGSIYGALTVERQGSAPVVRVNEPVLNAVLATLKSLEGRVDAEPPRLDGILSLKGVVEVLDEDEKESDRRAAEQAVTVGFDQTVVELAAMRRREGDALGSVLRQRLDEIGALAQRAAVRESRGAADSRARAAAHLRRYPRPGHHAMKPLLGAPLAAAAACAIAVTLADRLSPWIGGALALLMTLACAALARASSDRPRRLCWSAAWR